MEYIAPVYELLLHLSLFGLLFCGASVLVYKPKNQSQASKDLHSDPGQESCAQLNGQSYQLVCFLEDAPPKSLTGQVCEFAIPVMTPLACTWEDVPPTALTGQVCELATPLMTPLACILTQNWQKFYTQQLGKPGINYWEWKDKPESRNVCQELSFLLDLPEPTEYAKEVLESLGEGKDPFFQPILTRDSARTGNLLAGGDDCKSQGKFSDRDLWVQREMRLAFKNWHDAASELLGIDALKAIYKVCYGTRWEMIEQIIGQFEEVVIDQAEPWWKILGVQPSATSLQVEMAYKKLIRFWHPDINKNPDATDISSRINLAYEQYRALNQFSAVEHSQLIKINPNLLLKIRGWLKPLFSR